MNCVAEQLLFKRTLSITSPDVEQKNIAGQVLTYNSKKFHWLNRKLDQERIMNGLEPFKKPFSKKSDPKNRKNCNVKIKVKLPHVNKKPLARKRIFVQTPFSHSTLNLEQKNFTPQNPSLFRSTSCSDVTKITTPIWLQKSWKCVKILKKRQRPNTIQILWIVKNRSAIIVGWEDEGGY